MEHTLYTRLPIGRRRTPRDSTSRSPVLVARAPLFVPVSPPHHHAATAVATEGGEYLLARAAVKRYRTNHADPRETVVFTLENS